MASVAAAHPDRPELSLRVVLATVLALLRQPSVWAIIIGQYGQSFGMYGMLTWLPSFFHEKYDIETGHLASFTVAPMLTQALLGLASGLIADWLAARGVSLLNVRRGLQAVGSVGPAVFLIITAQLARSATAATVLIAIGTGLNALTLASVSVHHLDVTVANAGLIFALGNTASVLAALIGIPLTTLLLELTNSWSFVLLLFAAHYMIGGIGFCLLVRLRPLDPVVAAAVLQMRVIKPSARAENLQSDEESLAS